MFGFTFSSRKTTKKAVPQPMQATASPLLLSEKSLPLISEKHLPPPPAYETVVVAVPPAYSPTALFPSRDAADRPILSTRPRRSIRSPANLEMSSSGPHLLPPPRSAGRCVVVTSRPSVAGFEITKNLGFVQASAHSLGEVKLLLRRQGDERRAFAILDVVITTSDNSVYTAVGRAVRLRKE